MSNIKLTNDYWETSGIYDIGQNKTQRQINSDLNGAISSAITKNNSSYVGGATVTITGDRQTFTTNIDLVSGKQYLIVRKSDLNGDSNYIRCFSGSTSSNYADINAPKYFVTFTPNASGKLILYSRGTYSNYKLELAVFVYDNADVVLHDEVYFVDKSGYYNGSYTSFTQCLLDLKDNNNQKTIFIIGGDYDIYQEYVNANVPIYTGSNPMSEYFDYNVWIPTNTHVIGLGLVRLQWQPTTSQATYNQSRTVSPVNVAGSMTLENVEIYCKNGRYCIHDDAKGNFKYNRSVKKYINVKCYKLPNDSNYGTIHTVGMGIDREQYYVFDHCLFNNTVAGNCFYAHSRQTVAVALTEKNSSNLLINDCVFNSSGSPCVRFSNSNNVTDQLIRVNIDSCTFTQAMHLEGTPNKFLVTLNNSGSPTITIDDTSNSYSPIVFNSTYAGGRTKAEFKTGLDLASAFAVEMLQITGTSTGDGTNHYYVSNNYRGVWFVLGDANMAAILSVMVSSGGVVTLAPHKFNDADTTLTFSTATRQVSITSSTTANLSLVPFTINGSKTYRQTT